MVEPENPLESTPAETTVELVSIALQAVPVAGGVLSGTATFFLDRRKNQRLNEFLMMLANNLNQIQERINKDFIKSEEFRDLAEDVFGKAAETRQREKLDAFRAVFIHTVLSDNPKYDEIEEITNLIANWQSRHLVLLKILADPMTANNQRKVITEESNYIVNVVDVLQKMLPDWEQDQLTRTLGDLRTSGIFQMPSFAISTSSFFESKQMTPFGLKVAKFINNPLDS